MATQKVYFVFSVEVNDAYPVTLTTQRALSDCHEAHKLKFIFDYDYNTEAYADRPRERWQTALAKVTKLLDDKCDMQSKEYQEAAKECCEAADDFAISPGMSGDPWDMPYCRSHVKMMTIDGSGEEEDFEI